MAGNGLAVGIGDELVEPIDRRRRPAQRSAGGGRVCGM